MSSINMKNTFGFGFRFASERRSVESSLPLMDDAPPLPPRPRAAGHQRHPASSPTPDHQAAVPVATVNDLRQNEVDM